MPACNYPALASNSYPQPFHVLAFSPLLGNFPPGSTQTGGPTRILATVIPIPTHISVCHSSQNAPRIPPLGLFYSMSSQQQHSPITGTILNSNSRPSFPPQGLLFTATLIDVYPSPPMAWNMLNSPTRIPDERCHQITSDLHTVEYASAR
jgi:hypothetical protein